MLDHFIEIIHGVFVLQTNKCYQGGLLNLLSKIHGTMSFFIIYKKNSCLWTTVFFN
jgi:hypothetical protein